MSNYALDFAFCNEFKACLNTFSGSRNLAFVSSHHEAVSGLTAAVAPSVDVAIKRVGPGVTQAARTIARFQLR